MDSKKNAIQMCDKLKENIMTLHATKRNHFILVFV